jgi:hypothetical protein
MVGAGAVLGILLLVGAGLLFTADPGFLFAVIPIIMCAALIAGFQVLTVSVTLSSRLLRRTPGARLPTATVGFSVFLAGLAGCTFQPLMGLPLAAYGAVLFWLMTTPAAARDLGPWFVVRAPQQQRDVWFMPRSMRPQPRPPQPPFFTGTEFTGTEPSAAGSPSPFFTGAETPAAGQPPPFFAGAGQPRPRRQRPETWMELWQEGLSRIPISDAIALGIALLTFVVGDVLVFMNLVGADHGHLAVAVLLVGSSIAVHIVLERRMLARLGYA